MQITTLEHGGKTFPIDMAVCEMADWEKIMVYVDSINKISAQSKPLSAYRDPLEFYGHSYNLGNSLYNLGKCIDLYKQIHSKVVQDLISNYRIYGGNLKGTEEIALSCEGAVVNEGLDHIGSFFLAKQLRPHIVKYLPEEYANECDSGGIALSIIYGEAAVVWCSWWMRQWEYEGPQSRDDRLFTP